MPDILHHLRKQPRLDFEARLPTTRGCACLSIHDGARAKRSISLRGHCIANERFFVGGAGERSDHQQGSE